MMDTLHSTEIGAALAANQVRILKRLVVVDYGEYYLKLVNPVIIEKEGEMAKCFCHELEHLDGEVFLDKAVDLLEETE